MKTSFSRKRISVAAAALAVALAGGVGIAAANADVATGFGVTATTSAGASGQGSMTLVTGSDFPAEVTVTVFVVGTGGTLAGGVFEQPVSLAGPNASASVAYSCAGSSMELGVRFPGKGGPGFSVPAPCGAAAVEEPEVVWNQLASIIPGREGSGSATVEFDNRSDLPAQFYVTFGDEAPTSVTTVPAGETRSIPVHPGPGVVVRVFGTQDGNAEPKELAELKLSERVTVMPSPPAEEVPAPQPVAPAPPDPNAQPAPANQVPAAPVPNQPVITSAAPVANQPVTTTNGVPLAHVSADASTQSDGERFSFDTAVPSQGVSPLTVAGLVIAALAALYMISLVVRRRRA